MGTKCKMGDWSGFMVVSEEEKSEEEKFYMVVPMGSSDIPEYFPITRQEYDDFGLRKGDGKKIIEIQNRKKA